MSLKIPLLIREKLDYYLYFRVWQNRIKAVNSEYNGSLNEFTIAHEFIAHYGFCTRLGGSGKYFNFRRKDSIWMNTHIRNYRIQNTYTYLPKHYHHLILE